MLIQLSNVQYLMINDCNICQASLSGHHVVGDFQIMHLCAPFHLFSSQVCELIDTFHELGVLSMLFDVIAHNMKIFELEKINFKVYSFSFSAKTFEFYFLI